MSSHHELIFKVSEQLERWDYDLDRFEHRLQDLEGDARKQWHYALEELRLKRDGIIKRIGVLEEAAESAAEELYEGVYIAGEILKSSFDKARLEILDGLED